MEDGEKAYTLNMNIENSSYEDVHKMYFLMFIFSTALLPITSSDKA